MERILNSSVEKQTIYEIFRACRLCGGGAGYKMPIIQNVVDLDGSEVELKQKIRECVHIEVDQEDKMPPLICELCVDKVNDFYEFLEMCRQINIRTRLRLGLPPQAMPQEALDAGDCILGVTEQVFVNEDSNEPLSNKRSKSKHNEKVKKEEKVSPKKEPELLVKLEKHPGIKDSFKKAQAERIMRSGKRTKSPSPQKIPVRSSRNSNRDDDVSLARLKTQKKVPKLVITKGILKKEVKTEPTLLIPRLKRLRDKTPPKVNVPNKKVKLAGKPEPIKSNFKHSPRLSKSPPRLTLRSSPKAHQPPPKVVPKTASKVVPKQEPEQKLPSRSTPRIPPKPEPKPAPKPEQKVAPKPEPKLAAKPEPKVVQKSETKVAPKLEPKAAPKQSPKPMPKRPASPPPSTKCNICRQQFKISQSLSNHLRAHTATHTSEKLACNACQEWFKSPEDAAAHHKRHAKGKYYHCRRCFSDFQQYQPYLDHIKETCIPLYEVPDVQCPECWKYFPTENLLDSHDCPGEDGRPGGKCEKCSRTYATLKNLKKHESVCTSKNKRFELDPALKSKLREFLVRTARCDPLLVNVKNNRYDISNVDKEFGLDKNCVYPFRMKGQPRFAGMVKISDDLDFDEHYVHWDSDYSSDSTDTELSDSVLSPFLKKKNIDKLSTLSLKTIFSHKFLGKVPRKRRKLKLTNFSTNKENIDKIIENLDDTLDKDEESFSTSVNKNSQDETDKCTEGRNDDVVSQDNADSIPDKESKSALDTEKSIDEPNETGVVGNFDDKIDNRLCSQENENKMQIDQVNSNKNTEGGNLDDTNQVSTENHENLETSEKKIENNTSKENHESSLSDIQNSISLNTSEYNSQAQSNPKHSEVKQNQNDKVELNPKENSTYSYKNGELSQDIAKRNKTTDDSKEIDSHVVSKSNVDTVDSENKLSIETSSSSNIEKDSPLDVEEHAALKSGTSKIAVYNLSKVNKGKDNLKSSDHAASKFDISKIAENNFSEVNKDKDNLESSDHAALKFDISKIAENNLSEVNKDNLKCSDVIKSMNGDQDKEKDDMDDECDLEMDDKELMAELDAQIGENDNNKNVESEKCHTDVSKKNQSNELESISDDEFCFDT